MKTKEELNAIKEEVETVIRKLHELTEEEIAQVCGGFPLIGSQPFYSPYITDKLPAFEPPAEPHEPGWTFE